MAEVFFNGVAGRLEGRFHRSENPRAPLVLVLHPNPAQGGTMNNRVTYAVFQAFVNMGFSVLRFNFRGVGYSQGEIDGTASKGNLAESMYLDLGGTWTTYGIGTQFNFTDNLSVWGNLDRTTGGEVSTNYMMNAGVRYVF